MRHKYFNVAVIFLAIALIVSSSVHTIQAKEETNATSAAPNTPGPLRFERFAVEDGLPNTTVLYSLQDNNGYIWFATPDGLARYDGHSFRVFRADKDDETSLSNSNIFSLALDLDGNLWVGTDGGGLNRYDAASETFTSYQFDETASNGLSNNSVWSLYVDSHNQIWVGTRGGLNLFDRETKTFTVYSNDPENARSIANDVILTIEEDREGILWVGTRTGLSRYDSETDDFTNYLSDPENPETLSNDQIWDVLEDSEGNFWVATRYGGLNLFDRKNGIFKAYTHDDNDPNTISDNNIFHIFEDSNSNLWIATEKGGLNLMDRTTETFTAYQHDPNDDLTISSNDLFWIMEDESGSLWVTSRRNGVNQLVPELHRFSYYRYSVNQPMSLSNNNVYSLWAENDGVFWVGTGGGGLNRIDTNRQKSTVYQYDPEDENSLPNDTIYAIYGDEETGILWLGTVGGGLSRFDSRRLKFTNYTHDANDPTTISSNYITAIASAGENTLWVGTLGLGLDLFDTETGLVIEHLENDPNDTNSLSENTIYALLPDSDGSLWIGTARGGLSHYDPSTKQFTTYMNDENDDNSIIDNGVQSLAFGIRGRIWCGTPNGLSIFNPDKESFINYTTKDGLPGNSVFGILIDETSGDAWVSTSGGIGQYQHSKLQWRTYDVYDGLQGTQFNLFAYTKSPDGNFLFGGPNGVNTFFPEDVTVNNYSPEIILTDLQIWNQSVAIGSQQLPQAINTIEKITLTPDDDMFTIHYSATNYQIPQHNQFQTKLEGFESEWSPASQKSEVTYTNLNPGTYMLYIKASNNDHIWNEEPRTLLIEVLPEWWETTWFQILLGVGIIGIILLFINWRIHDLQNQKRHLVLNVRERTKELQEEINHREAVEEELRLSNHQLEEHIDEISLLQEQLRIQAIRDDLTGLYNRRYLNEVLPREISRAERKGDELTIMMLDLDRFKHINDSYGHSVGDQVLVEFSQALTRLTRHMDIVCRYGGEEFIVIAPGMKENEALNRAEDIRNTIETIPVMIDGENITVSMTVSIGIACYPNHAKGIDDLINAADTALYDVKNTGRNQIRMYQNKMQQ